MSLLLLFGGEGVAALPTPNAVGFADHSGPRYGVVDHSGPRYGVADHSGARYGVEVP